MSEIAGTQLDETGRNFVQTLAENRRLARLPEISGSSMSSRMPTKAWSTSRSLPPHRSARSSSARSREALKRRLKREVRLHTATDPALIGGAVIRAGDLVIDGSLRTRLERIAYELTA